MGEIIGDGKDYYAKIGNRITEIRESQGVTLRELAEKIGVSESSVSRYERGGTKIDFPTLNKIASALNVSARNLLDWNGEEDNYYLDTKTREIAEMLKSDKESLFFMDAYRKLNPKDYQYVKELVERLTKRGSNSDDD